MRKAKVIYLSQHIPKELAGVPLEFGLVTKDKLLKYLEENGVEILAIVRMSELDITPIDGYRLGITKGLASILPICSDFLNKIDAETNAAYISGMYRSLKPFYSELTVISGDTEECIADKAKSLLALRAFVVDYYLSKIELNIKNHANGCCNHS